MSDGHGNDRDACPEHLAECVEVSIRAARVLRPDRPVDLRLREIMVPAQVRLPRDWAINE